MSATDALLAGLLGLSILSAWIGALALPRLPTALDRLHAVAFVNVAGGAFLTAAAFVADGASTRAFKVLILWLVLVVAGAALSHATGRALLVREGGRA